MLGHADVRTTMPYVHVGDREIEAAAERARQAHRYDHEPGTNGAEPRHGIRVMSARDRLQPGQDRSLYRPSPMSLIPPPR